MNCIVIHGSNARDQEKVKQGYPQQNKRNWIPWIKKELEKKGVKTETPLMPKNWSPLFNEWKKEFERLKVNENTVLVGHSAGGGFLVRWLGESQTRVRKLILVAPAKLHSGNFDELKDLLRFRINKETPIFVDKIVIFVSSNDHEEIKESVEIYSEKLKVKPIELTNMGHFITKHMGTEEFPELLNEILKE